MKLKPDKIHYSYISKGKRYSNLILNEGIDEFIFDNKIDVFEPFKNFNLNNAQRMIHYRCKRLYETKKIQCMFSYHSLRHYFSVKHYRKNKDIYELSKKLGHTFNSNHRNIFKRTKYSY